MLKLSISVLLLIVTSECQENGSFWWKNKDLVDTAAQSRSLKESSAKIRTLPPRYRHEELESTSTTTKKTFSIYDRDSHDDEDGEKLSEYKYNNDQPDCVCVPKNLCNANNTLITDGNGLIDER